MKQSSHGVCSIPGLIMLFGLPVLFSSCNAYNFSQPQPVDKINIYEFPKEFIGQWFAKNEPESDCYIITSKNVLLIMHDTERIVNGAWPQLTDSGDYLYPPDQSRGFKTINYDSLKKPVDTIDHFLVRGQYIYERDPERFLGKGYPYGIKNDTIIIIKNDTTCIDLGKNAFLRQLSKNFYVLNIRKTILDYDEFNDWWQIMILEKKEDQTVNIGECTDKAGELSCMFYDRSSKSDIFYFDCQWTTADMLRLVKEGYFEVSSNNYKGAKKTRME